MSTAVSDTAAQASVQVRDPAHGALLGSVPAAQPEHIVEVVRAVAKVQPLWALQQSQEFSATMLPALRPEPQFRKPDMRFRYRRPQPP